MLGGLGTWEILLIFLVILLLFGAKRIPEMAKGVGKGITEFKKAVQDAGKEVDPAPDARPSEASATDTGRKDASTDNEKT